jgi:hypothetical protein
MGDAAYERPCRFVRAYRKRLQWRRLLKRFFLALRNTAAHFVHGIGNRQNQGMLSRIAQLISVDGGKGHQVVQFLTSSKIASALPKAIQARLPKGLRSPEIDASRLQVEQLDTAVWHKILRTLARAVIHEQIDDWAEYFSDLRNVVRKVVASRAEALTVGEKENLIERLIVRLDELEKSWPAPKSVELDSSKVGVGQR